MDFGIKNTESKYVELPEYGNEEHIDRSLVQILLDYWSDN